MIRQTSLYFIENTMRFKGQKIGLSLNENSIAPFMPFFINGNTYKFISINDFILDDPDNNKKYKKWESIVCDIQCIVFIVNHEIFISFILIFIFVKIYKNILYKIYI